MKEGAKKIFRMTGGDKVLEWEDNFGVGISGAVLSICAGIAILIFPNLIAFIIASYLIIRGMLEIFKHYKRKLIR